MDHTPNELVDDAEDLCYRPRMARKKSPTLTEAEYRLMDILWNRETATVADVVGLRDHPPLADNTVLTTIRILEQKGHVRHKAIGRAFVYKALVEREEAQHAVMFPRTTRRSGTPRIVASCTSGRIDLRRTVRSRSARTTGPRCGRSRSDARVARRSNADMH